MKTTNNKTVSKKAGFTLIELMVVISVIGLLSTIVLASLSMARKKAQDAYILSELRQVRLALEIYYSNYGGYPHPTTNSSGLYCVGGTDCKVAGVSYSDNLSTADPAFTYLKDIKTYEVAGGNKGFIYQVCTTAGRCPIGTSSNDPRNAYVFTMTNGATSALNTGLVTIAQTAGLWEPVHPGTVTDLSGTPPPL